MGHEIDLGGRRWHVPEAKDHHLDATCDPPVQNKPCQMPFSFPFPLLFFCILLPFPNIKPCIYKGSTMAYEQKTEVVTLLAWHDMIWHRKTFCISFFSPSMLLSRKPSRERVCCGQIRERGGGVGIQFLMSRITGACRRC